jgi:hypothetical protein
MLRLSRAPKVPASDERMGRRGKEITFPLLAGAIYALLR